MRHNYCDLFDAVDGARASLFQRRVPRKTTAFSACVAVL